MKEGLEEQHESIMRVRNVVKYVRSSPARLKAFKRCVEKEKIDSKSLLFLDVETQWNSTYLMLNAAENFEKAFERLGDEEQKFIKYFDCYELNQEECEGKKGKVNKVIGPPMDMDWINVRNFMKFLKIFYNVTLKFSSSSYITSNAFFRELATLHVSLTTIMNKGDYHMASMAIRMKDKFNKYWGNIDNMNWFLFVAILLDPRYKLKYVSFGLATIYGSDPSFVKRMIEKIEDTLHLLYKQYAHSSLEHTSKDKDSIQDNIFMQLDGEDDPGELLESQFAKHLEEEQCAESKSEVTRYLFDGCEKLSKDFDVLKWWKSSSSKYPILSKIAKDVLDIPVSTIASESAFSTSGRVIDAFRSSLSTKMVEALICTQDWLRDTPQIDLCAILEDIEKFEEFEKGK
ncbi:UNVERIFIED_CONTAM: Zinc finger BED domain-containing protein RICESLEEPER 2 [Sesamum radiatum]|uniref:Zinc finger BED domain-containing protein RICESLEEPER 2 n=1 Tax=Sesamum radiatum TaxID=300843 RepID=A0AAW2L8H3_SESRA